MFIGHYAVGLAAKSISPKPSLGTYFAAVSFLDLLWPILLILGIENVSLEPQNTPFLRLAFTHYPWSHSLLTTPIDIMKKYLYCVPLLFVLIAPCPGADTTSQPYLTFGIFIGRIEEGARIFTPVRLLPPDLPESLGHDFPTVEVFHASEFQTLLLLGEKSGLKLWATLERYPREPENNWKYPGFRPPPVDSLHDAHMTVRPAAEAPLPGLRIAAFVDRFPIAFIVDTRTLSLKARHMKRSTSSGLDITRKEFLDGLTRAAALVPEKGTAIIRYR